MAIQIVSKLLFTGALCLFLALSLTGCAKKGAQDPNVPGSVGADSIDTSSIGAETAANVQGAEASASPRRFNLFPSSSNAEGEGTQNTGGGLFGLFKKKNTEQGDTQAENTGGLFNSFSNSNSGGLFSNLPQFGGIGSSDCDQQIAHARSTGTNHMLISFEGLASKNAGFVRKNIVQRAHGDVNSGWVSKSYGWKDVSSASDCAQRFQQETGGKISVVGHSFGGGIATFDFAEQMNQRGVTIENAVTLDPRNMTNDVNFATTRNFNQYSKPSNVRNFTNFYQNSGLRGYGVEGANNVELNSTHTGIASEDAVYSHIRGLLAN